MLETRSAVYKMLKNSAHRERQINYWPPPFTSEVTPYGDQTDFNNLVRRGCSRRSVAPRISKVIVLGDVAVGKTSLVNRFCHKSFDNNYKATIGVDFEVERFDVLGAPFNLQIWDTAGQERFKCIAASYYRGANVIMVVFDLGSLMSLSHCHQWLTEASRSNNAGRYFVFLVGTKRDLLRWKVLQLSAVRKLLAGNVYMEAKSNRVYEVIEKRATSVAKTLRAEYWAVSAKTGDGVDELFARVAAMSFDASVYREITSIIDRDTLSLGTDLTALGGDKRRIEANKGKKWLINWNLCSLL